MSYPWAERFVCNKAVRNSDYFAFRFRFSLTSKTVYTCTKTVPPLHGHYSSLSDFHSSRRILVSNPIQIPLSISDTQHLWVPKNRISTNDTDYVT